VAAVAAVVGTMSAFVSYALVGLIGAITNIVYYQRLSSALVSPMLGELAVRMTSIMTTSTTSVSSTGTRASSCWSGTPATEVCQ
jgi:plasmid replication initiation protein